MEKSEKTPKKLKIRKRKNMLFFPLILPILRIKKNVKKAYFSRGEQGGAREERGGGAPKCNFLDFTPSFCQIVFNFMIASCEKSKQQFSTNKKKIWSKKTHGGAKTSIHPGHYLTFKVKLSKLHLPLPYVHANASELYIF